MVSVTVADSPARHASIGVGEAERARERSLLLAFFLDMAIWTPCLVFAVWSNSLTLLGDVLRGGVFIVLSLLLLLTLRRIHRGQTAEYDFGVGKVEQFASLVVGVALIGAAAWMGMGMIARAMQPASQPALGLAFAAVASAVNLVLNLVALRALWRAGRDGTSIIMTAQLRARLSKVISSALVTLAVAVNAVAGVGPIGTAADLAGAGLVTVLMASFGITMCREALPSLLDRTLDEHRQAAINRVLASHFDKYEALGAVRARMSGRDPLVEIALGFAPTRTVADLQALGDSVRAELSQLVPGARVTIVPFAVRDAGE
jgi:cation diffusion facilitator family transporter